MTNAREIEAAIKALWRKNGKYTVEALAGYRDVGAYGYKVAYSVTDPTFDQDRRYIVHHLQRDLGGLHWGHYDLTEAEALAEMDA